MQGVTAQLPSKHGGRQWQKPFRKCLATFPRSVGFDSISGLGLRASPPIFPASLCGPETISEVLQSAAMANLDSIIQRVGLRFRLVSEARFKSADTASASLAMS